MDKKFSQSVQFDVLYHGSASFANTVVDTPKLKPIVTSSGFYLSLIYIWQIPFALCSWIILQTSLLWYNYANVHHTNCGLRLEVLHILEILTSPKHEAKAVG